MNWQEFVKWEKASRQTIDFKVIYVDITGDLVAGLLLSQIVYWFLPDNKGNSKLRASVDGQPALAKQRGDWWEECRISAKQYDRAIKIIQELGIAEVRNTLFNGKKTPAIVLNGSGLTERVKSVLPKGKNRSSPKVKTGFDEKGKPLTETTTETTTKNTPTGGSKKNKKLATEQRNKFDRFWSVYPRKVGKGQARKAWKSIDPDDALVEKMLKALEQQKKCEQWRRDGGKYIPYPSTWLNGERWDDEVEAQEAVSLISGFDDLSMENAARRKRGRPELTKEQFERALA